MALSGVCYPRGFRAGAIAAGVKHGVPERLDVALLASEGPGVAAALFTTNQVIAAPCLVTRRHLERGPVRGVVVNSGNANACTGERGEADALAMAAAAAQLLGGRPEEMAVASTGVIGVPLPAARIAEAIGRIELSPEGGEDFARAIMTTDTRPKIAQREVRIQGATVRIGGAAKGAGMIHPNMATLLGFITTDAALDSVTARRLLRRSVDETFNAISVDGDTSTNDMVLLLAGGASGVAVGGDGGAFADALTDLCAELARGIVADAEGAGKVFEVRVSGAASGEDARAAARAITSSNLVKAAVHGADPNWGRVLAAAGRSGARVDAGRASIRIGRDEVYVRGAPRAFDPAVVRRTFEQPEIRIELDLGLGDGSARAWGCDLSAEYVRINADYTT